MTFCSKDPTSIDQARDFLVAHRKEKLFAAQDGMSLCLHSGSLEFHEARKVMGDAFGGETAKEGGVLLNTFLAPLGMLKDGPKAKKDRQEANAFCLGFFANELYQKNGLIMGIKDDQDELQSVVVFREYDPAREHRSGPKIVEKISEFIRNIRTYIMIQSDPLGVPEFFADKDRMKEFNKSMKKLEAVGDPMRELHEQYGPKDTHWYVGIVASNPKCQGSGYCKEAMDILCKAADECGVECYLECEEKNKGYYEKFQYKSVKKLVKKFALEAAGGLGSPDWHLMVRQPC